MKYLVQVSVSNEQLRQFKLSFGDMRKCHFDNDTDKITDAAIGKNSRKLKISFQMLQIFH